jgi:hypothetical protein
MELTVLTTSCVYCHVSFVFLCILSSLSPCRLVILLRPSFSPFLLLSANQQLHAPSHSSPYYCRSEYGFMSFKLNTCTPAWMLSFETQQLYLKNIAYQKESLIFTQVGDG